MRRESRTEEPEMYSPKNSIRRYAVGCAALLCLILVVALTSRCTSDSITGGETLAPQSPAPQSPAPQSPAPQSPAPENPAPPADPGPMGTLSEVGSVTLSPDSLYVEVFKTAQLTVIVRDTTGAVIANPQVFFFTKGLTVGTVDNTGLVTGFPSDQCLVGTVIARSGGVTSNTAVITITVPPETGCWG